MPVAPLKSETEYLRAFAEVYFGEIAFDNEAEQQMRSLRVSLVEIIHALRTGSVVSSEKEDAAGARWIVEGTTCDEEQLVITMEVFVDQYHLCIKGIANSVRS